LWTGLDKNDPILIDSKEILDIEYGITVINPEGDGFGFISANAISMLTNITPEFKLIFVKMDSTLII